MHPAAAADTLPARPVAAARSLIAHRCGVVAAAGVLLAAGFIVVLHVLAGSRIDPLARTMSDYALLPGGEPLFVASAACLLIASTALIAGLHKSGVRGGGMLHALCAVWCAGLLLVAAFPTDPPAAALTFTGFVHRYAAGAFLFALPPLARLLGRELATLPGTKREVRRLSVLSAASWWCLAFFLICHLPVVFPWLPGVELLSGAHAVLGLAERLLFAVDLAVLLVIASVLGVRGRWDR
ncbi:MAG: DUF998 domain-containing protein [Sciscionella sp.]